MPGLKVRSAGSTNIMSESLSYASAKSGMPPGSLVHVGDVLVDQTILSVIDYSKDVLQEAQIESALPTSMWWRG